MNAVAGLQIDAVDPEERFRRTALVLHGLSATDRDWLLARLPEAQVAKLRQLLCELIELGLPGDASLVRSALSAAAPTAAVPAHEGVLAAATAACMHECLAKEPDQFVAVVLAARSWPWADDLLVHLGPACARRLGELGRDWHAPVALQEAVLTVLARKVEERSANVTRIEPRSCASPPVVWWRRFVRRPGT
jgi:hypothetical protein